MKFRSQAPDEIFVNPFADKYVTTLDELDEFKQLEIFSANKMYRPPVCFNYKWLRNHLEKNYGFPTIPTDFPKDVLDALYLNAEKIYKLRGSRVGFKLWLWCLTFGNIAVNETGFYPIPEYIILDDIVNGYLDKFDPEIPSGPGDPDMQLFDDLNQSGVSAIAVTIATKYSAHVNIKKYITDHVKEYLTFMTTGAVITLTFNPGVYNTYTEPYQYFVV